MGSPLPEIPYEEFRSRLSEISPVDLPGSAYASLHAHYLELRRWSPRLSLIGPGTAAEVLARHYGESLAALPLIEASDLALVDVGSGAGFPGLVIAAALPRLEVTLVESRQKKWAFLAAAVRRSGLSCSCLNARVGRSLPEGFPAEVDVVTCRAVAIPPEILEAAFKRSPHVRFLLWQSGIEPSLPLGLTLGRELPIEGSDRRRIFEVRPLD
jgi:16S rRNA (guanine(527)-N(7))-methyltransferase RsmG